MIDSANGAAYRVAPLVFGELGATMFQLGDKPDGKNINLDCGSLYPERMSALVKERKADIAHEIETFRLAPLPEPAIPSGAPRP